MRDLAPVVLFVYNRPEHTKKTVDALCRNLYAKESELYVYSDGYKNEYDREEVLEVRDYLKNIRGFKKIGVIEREKNIGLANSIISGVTEVVDKCGIAIVLEDDLVQSNNRDEKTKHQY